jgi:RNA polymerase-binding transcription factor DksA
MTELQKQAYRQRLLALADRIKGGVSVLRDAALRNTGGEASGSLSNTPLHLADLGSDNFEQEIAVGLLQNEQQLLSAIAGALDRLDAGDFGRCDRCGKPIPEGRLKEVPYASRCVLCEQQVEQEKGSHGASTRQLP